MRDLLDDLDRWRAAVLVTWWVRAAAVGVLAAWLAVVVSFIPLWREIDLRFWFFYDESYRGLGGDQWWAGGVRLGRFERGAEGVHLRRHPRLQSLAIAAHKAPGRQQSRAGLGICGPTFPMANDIIVVRHGVNAGLFGWRGLGGGSEQNLRRV